MPKPTQPNRITEHTPLEVTEDEFHQMDSDSEGLCVACGGSTGSVEPDARQYPCSNCGADEVYGAAELLQMGLIVIAGDEARRASR